MSKHNYMHVGPVNALPVDQHVKNREAEQLRADIEAYQAAGGKIEVLGNTPRRDVHDYKKAEKGRKGGRKNKKDTIMTQTFARPDTLSLQEAEEEELAGEVEEVEEL